MSSKLLGTCQKYLKMRKTYPYHKWAIAKHEINCNNILKLHFRNKMHQIPISNINHRSRIISTHWHKHIQINILFLNQVEFNISNLKHKCFLIQMKVKKTYLGLELIVDSQIQKALRKFYLSKLILLILTTKKKIVLLN